MVGWDNGDGGGDFGDALELGGWAGGFGELRGLWRGGEGLFADDLVDEVGEEGVEE